MHPGSGSGRIKFDGSDETEVMEVKNALTSHTLKGDYLNRLFTHAVQQGKEAVLVIRFERAGIEAEVRLRRI